MKLNWGQSIAIFYSFFVVVMVGMVVYSKGLDHSLVVDNYYEQDINYQQHIDRLENTRQLDQDLQIVQDEQNQVLRFAFPGEMEHIGGTVLFYRANDKSKDFTVEIPDAGSRVLEVATGDLVRGLWKVRVNWNGDGKTYYKEETVVL